MSDLYDFDPSELTTEGADADRLFSEEAYKDLTPAERVLLAAQEGYCIEHGYVFPTNYNKARSGSGDVFLDALIVELVEDLEYCEEDSLETVRQAAIQYLEDSIDILKSAIEGIRNYGGLHASTN